MKFKQAKKWNVLLVQNTGKIVRMSWHTCITIIGCLILLTAASTAGVMSLMLNAPEQKSPPPPAAASNAESHPESLAANLPEDASESAVLENGGKKSQTPSDEKTADEKGRNAAADKKAAGSPEEGMIPDVAIQDPAALYDKRNQILTYRFKLKNLMETQASGHAVVVLKRNPKRTKTWITLPDNVPLVKGKPDGETEGNSFSISNYKVMRFTGKNITNPKRYNIATIFIFDKSGKLIIEEDHPITID